MTLFLERRDLLARFREGERPALEETYRHYAPIVASFLGRGFSFKSGEQTRRFLGYSEPFDLDNALAETFVRAFKPQARLGYDGLNPYKSYLYGIARNLVIDELRSKEVLMSAVSFDETEEPADEARVSAEDDVLAKELAGLCQRFVGRLPERDRIFFHSRFEQAATQVQAGVAAGLSHMQARSLERKLRERFLKFMHASGYLEGTR